MMAKAKSALFAAVLFFTAADVSAQAIYTKLDAGGQVRFTDLPYMNPQTETAPADDAPRVPARISGVAIGIGSRRAAIITANEAERRLAQAQLRRNQGMEPLPGERVRGSGSELLNHRYWQRQEKLRRVVEQAQRRSSETRQTQLASR